LKNISVVFCPSTLYIIIIIIVISLLKFYNKKIYKRRNILIKEHTKKHTWIEKRDWEYRFRCGISLEFDR
jgi:uncharacterized protein YxeA